MARPAHSPGAQGHSEEILKAIRKLQSKFANDMGNQAYDTMPEDATGDFDGGQTDKLYKQQQAEDARFRRMPSGKSGRRRGAEDGNDG